MGEANNTVWATDDISFYNAVITSLSKSKKGQVVCSDPSDGIFLQRFSSSAHASEHLGLSIQKIETALKSKNVYAGVNWNYEERSDGLSETKNKNLLLRLIMRAGLAALNTTDETQDNPNPNLNNNPNPSRDPDPTFDPNLDPNPNPSPSPNQVNLDVSTEISADSNGWYYSVENDPLRFIGQRVLR
jgi:hypothetical protein